MHWPLRASPANLHEIAERGGSSHRTHNLKHLALDYPFEFFAQVDLAEAAALGDIAKDLPTEGRLLFFYDSMTGPWNDAKSVTRVIWDRSAKAALQRKPIPDVLQKLAREYNIPDPEELQVQRTQDLASIAYLEKGDPEAFAEIRDAIIEGTDPEKQTEFKPPYWGEPQTMKTKTVWTLPVRFSIEAQTHDSLRALFETSFEEDDETLDFSDVYDEFMEVHRPEEARGRPHQLLGLPSSEQDDPRYDAAAAEPLGTPFADRDDLQKQKDEIMRNARDWLLLLQISLADCMQDDLIEGTV